jgi:protein MpaA
MRRIALLVVAVLTGAVLVAVWLASPSASATAAYPAVQQIRVLGYSVLGRPIMAYRMGDPYSATKAIIVGQMHGDEHAGVIVASAIVHSPRAITGIDLWVIPTMNPDGDARHTRQNAHGVDLNRNWPDYWAPLTGQYYAGPRPMSEPETRAMYTFLRSIRPRYLVVLHQPLNGVDTTDGGAKDPAFSRVLAHNLGLGQKAFRCWSFCHGSMTGYMTNHLPGAGITVEFGSRPSTSYLTGVAAPGILRSIRAGAAALSTRNPRARVDQASAVGSRVTISGWGFDPDDRAHAISLALYDGPHRIAVIATNRWRRDVNAVYRMAGRHGYGFQFAAKPGTHTYCVLFYNIESGAGNTKLCRPVKVAPPTTPAPTTSAPTTTEPSTTAPTTTGPATTEPATSTDSAAGG